MSCQSRSRPVPNHIFSSISPDHYGNFSLILIPFQNTGGGHSTISSPVKGRQNSQFEWLPVYTVNRLPPNLIYFILNFTLKRLSLILSMDICIKTISLKKCSKYASKIQNSARKSAGHKKIDFQEKLKKN